MSFNLNNATQPDNPGGAEENRRPPLRPTIAGENNVVTPVATESLNARSKNDSKTHKTLCNDVQIESLGEDEWRITLSAFVVESQLERLIEMRVATNEVRVITNFKSFQDVQFDEISVKQTEDMNNFAGKLPSGVNVDQPLYKVELQTQDENPVPNS
jgi:hypothetical protein